MSILTGPTARPLTPQQARAKMDLITHGPMGLRSNFKPEEAEELDRLGKIAFPDPPKPPNSLRIDGKDYFPTARTPDQDFLPDEVARVVAESNPLLRLNGARALRASVMGKAAFKTHAYWDHNAGDHEAWQIAMKILNGISLGEE